MSNRQKRVDQSDIPDQIDQLIGRKASIVLKDKSVVYVRLLSFKNNNFDAKDFIHRKHQIALSSIDEVILELNA